jgi:hypothetical protein
MSATAEYLAARGNSLNALVDEYDLAVNRHPTLPLCVLN